MRDVLIQSSALILALVPVRFLFRRTLSRRAQYALWALVLARLLLPLQLPAAGFSVLRLAAPLRRTAETAVTERVEPPLRTGVERALRAAVRGPENGFSPEESASLGVIGGADGPTAVSVTGSPLWLQLLTLVRLGGSGVLALWFLLVNLRFARKLRRTRVPLEGASCACPVYLCDDVPSPCLFGLLRPAIYVTSPGAKDPQRLRHVLAHEETHLRQGDPLWSLLRGVCLTVWWFNPLVWLAARLSLEDCELACDEGTLKRLGADQRRAYGETLLALIPVRGRAHPLLSATAMTAGKRQLKNRITRIAANTRPAGAALAAALVLSGAVCAAAFTGNPASGPHRPGTAAASQETSSQHGEEGYSIGDSPSGAAASPRAGSSGSEIPGEGSGTFTRILGYDGYFVDTEIAPRHFSRVYYARTEEGAAPLAESFGFEANDAALDLDGDGFRELVCSCVYGGDGARRLLVYRRQGLWIRRGSVRVDRLSLPDWPRRSTASWREYRNGVHLLLQYDGTEGPRTVSLSLSRDFEWENCAPLPGTVGSEVLPDAGDPLDTAGTGAFTAPGAAEAAANPERGADAANPGAAGGSPQAGSAGDSMDAEGTGIPPAAAASRVSLEAEDYGLTEGMLRMETSPEFPSLSVEALGAFFLHTDGAGAESASYWLYRRFLEDPESVLEYLNRVRGLRPSGNASPEGTAEQILSRAIVFSHSPGDGYEETLRRCREEFPQPPFSELLELLEPRDTPGN